MVSKVSKMNQKSKVAITKHQINNSTGRRLVISSALGSYREQLPWIGNSKTPLKREVNEFSSRPLCWPLRRAEVKGVCRSRLGCWTKAMAIVTSRLPNRRRQESDSKRTQDIENQVRSVRLIRACSIHRVGRMDCHNLK